MRQTLMRVWGLLVLAGLCLVGVMPAGAANYVPVTVVEDSFTLTTDQGRWQDGVCHIREGARITVSTQKDLSMTGWTLILNVWQGEKVRYGLVDANGKISFMPVEVAVGVSMDYNITGNSRSFLLQVPEEYRDYSMQVQVNAGSGPVSFPIVLDVPRAKSFEDVGERDWFKPYVDAVSAAERMAGVSESRFDPEGSMTVAQLLVLAANQYAANHAETIPEGGGAWYQRYYDYALQKGLIQPGQFTGGLDRAATRFEMVAVMDKALSAAQTSPTQTIPDGYIPDVAESQAGGGTIYRWYRAGLLAGDGEHRFQGERAITRAEVAVILCRLGGLL